MKTLDLVKEEQELRAYLEGNLKSQFEDVAASAKTALAWLDDDFKENKLYAATFNYFATGEGMSHSVFAHLASSKREFVLSVMEKLGGHYFTIGCSWFVDSIPADEPVVRALLSQDAIEDLNNQMSAGRCYYKLSVEQYLNCS